jgi:dihydrolipoamide dehydrogenase
VISAVGVVGNIENSASSAGREDRSRLHRRSTLPHQRPGIYAIGDVAGPPMLAHKAEHEGVICVEAIKGLHPHPMDKLLIPGCTYCHPQIASGRPHRGEGQGRGQRHPRRPLPFVGNGKAIAQRGPGLVKTIFDKKTGKLLGAHMVGPEVTELIQGFVVAMNLETTEEELYTIFPHPTLSETMKEACSTPMAAC